MKKSLIVLVSLFITPQAFANFSDVPTEHPYAEAINWAQENNIIQGFSDGTFKPDQKINRAELTKIIIEANFEDSEIYGDNCFPDVNDEWFAKYVCTAKREGIVKGYEDGIFRPWQNISFVEAIKVITNSNKIELINDESLTEWYEPYVLTFLKKGLIPNTIFQYDHIINRAEIIEIIFCESNKLKKYINTTEYKIKTEYVWRFKGNYNKLTKKDDKVFYNKEEIPNADVHSFKYISTKYSKDKNHVYRHGKIMNNVDPKTFEILLKYVYTKDKSHVYCDGNILEDADPNTFEIQKNDVDLLYLPYENKNSETSKESFYSKYSEGLFWADKNNVFIECEKLNVDVNTFKAIDVGNIIYFKDKNHGYLYRTSGKGGDEGYFHTISESDGASFKFLKYDYSKDKNNCYKHGEIVDMSECDTIEKEK